MIRGSIGFVSILLSSAKIYPPVLDINKPAYCDAGLSYSLYYYLIIVQTASGPQPAALPSSVSR